MVLILAGRVASAHAFIITGGNRGLGLACAHALRAKTDAGIVLAVRRPEAPDSWVQVENPVTVTITWREGFGDDQTTGDDNKELEVRVPVWR